MRWLLLGFVLLLVACGSQGNPLANTEWQLVALGNADASDAVVAGNPTAEFTTAKDMTGWTGCNAFGAGYRVRGSELLLDKLTWTEAGCPSLGLFQQEQRIQSLLATVERFEVSGEQLTLHSEGGQALVFERVRGGVSRNNAPRATNQMRASNRSRTPAFGYAKLGR